MKKIIGIASLVLALFSCQSCQENETIATDFTGNESTYPLVAGSAYPINGTVSFKEKKDGSTLITVSLSGTEGELKHPVHLHLGNLSMQDADIAALLAPLKGKTGISETILAQLANETSITYSELIALNASIKVHFGESGPDKNIILAAGNIGSAVSDDNAGGRSGIGICK